MSNSCTNIYSSVCVCFLFSHYSGMVSLIYGYDLGWMRNRAPESVVLGLQIFCGITTVLSVPGALQTMYGHVKGIFH